MHRDRNKRYQAIKISLFIASIFVIFFSITYAFINMSVTGTKRQVITAGSLELELAEENAITLTNAMPMFDEVGMLQDSFDFQLKNTGDASVEYILKLVDITDSDKERLDSSIVKYGLTKDGKNTIQYVSSLTDSQLDTGIVMKNQTIQYSLRLWVDSATVDNALIADKTLSYQIGLTFVEYKLPLLATMKQGDYVAYVGNNGCLIGKEEITGVEQDAAESGDSCLGTNAHENIDTNATTFGYCYRPAYKYSVTGWRIAYIDDRRAFLVSVGSPECIPASPTPIATYIDTLNERAKRYCNSDYVDGDCTDNSDSWSINDNDFYKITSVINNGVGKHLSQYQGNPYCLTTSDASCGLGNDLIDNGGFYRFATGIDYGLPHKYSAVWTGHVGNENANYSYGLRPIIRLSSSVVVTGGTGTMNDPYTIAKG